MVLTCYTCGYPPCMDIFSVSATYVVSIGGPCSVYNEWTTYSDFSSDDLELLTNNCMMESSATITPLPSVVTLLLLTLMSSIGRITLYDYRRGTMHAPLYNLWYN